MNQIDYDQQYHASSKFFARVGAKAGMQIALSDYIRDVSFAYHALQKARALRLSGKKNPSYYLQMGRVRHSIQQAQSKIASFREYESVFTDESASRGRAVVNNKGRV